MIFTQFFYNKIKNKGIRKFSSNIHTNQNEILLNTKQIKFTLFVILLNVSVTNICLAYNFSKIQNEKKNIK